MKNLKLIPDTDLMYDVDTLIVYPVNQLCCCDLHGGTVMKELPDGIRETCMEFHIECVMNGLVEIQK